MNTVYTPTLQWTACEILACAILDLYPDTQLIEGSLSGFSYHYDFIFKKPLGDQYIPQVEERMRSLITDNVGLSVSTMMRVNAIEFFQHHKQYFKAEMLIQDKSQLVEIVKIGGFHDLLFGSVLETTKDAAANKIISITEVLRVVNGEDRPVTRITGLVANDKQQLKQLQKDFQQARNRDHRIVGTQQNYFREIVPQTWAWLPQGVQIKDKLRLLWAENVKNQQFLEVSSPKIGPLTKFSNNLYEVFVDLEGEEHTLIPSFSETHAQLFSKLEASQQALPVKWAEWGTVYKQVKASQRVGLLNEPAIIQDIFTIFCGVDSLRDNLISSLQFIHQISTIFGFEHHWYVCARRQRNSPIREGWDAAAATLVDALQASGIGSYLEEAEPVRVGPKVEMRIRDVYQREWVCGYLEVNLLAPQRYELAGRLSRGMTQRPSMITGSLFGSVERFAALLIEQVSGEKIQQLLNSLQK